jgi:hypothetical protein
MADSHINGSKGKEIPELTRQSGFSGNSYLIVFARLQSPVLSDNATWCASDALWMKRDRVNPVGT